MQLNTNSEIKNDRKQDTGKTTMMKACISFCPSSVELSTLELDAFVHTNGFINIVGDIATNKIN